MNILDGVIGRRIKPDKSQPSQGIANRDQHAPDDANDYRRSMLHCSYEHFITHWLPQWYTTDEIADMIAGLNYIDSNKLKDQDLP